MESALKLSVVVKVVGGKPFVRRCVQRLVEQRRRHAMEIIVPYDSLSREVGDLREEFPEVAFVEMSDDRVEASPRRMSQHERYDRRASKGLEVARGDVVALLEDYDVPAADWRQQVIAAHAAPHGAIGGAVEHAGAGGWNWAVYFADFGRYGLPLAEGPVEYVTDINVSYKRAALESTRELWIERYSEVTLHWALARRGVTLWMQPRIVVYQDRGALSVGSILRERFQWGRLFGALRARESSAARRVVHAAASPLIPLLLASRQLAKALAGRRHVARVLSVLPHFMILTYAWCLGELVGGLVGCGLAPMTLSTDAACNDQRPLARVNASPAVAAGAREAT